jgi:thymidylate kinase
VREGFLMLAKSNPGRYMVIDASAPEVKVHADIWSVLEKR